MIGEWYANGYTADVRHQAWSVTKTFVAAVVGIALSEGHIDSLQDPIDAYVPDLAGTEWEGVSIEDVLQMESGVHWDEGTPVLAINTQVEQWRDLALDLHTEGALGKTRNEFLATLPSMGYEPGTKFSYNSGNTQVLAWMTELIYDQDFETILQEKLWQPMGADGDAVMTSDRIGDVVASHGLFARPHDFARFGEVLRNGGRTPEGRQVVPAEWVKAMTTMTEVSGGIYGLQTWAHPIAAPDAFTASGFQGQKITVMPSDCMTGVRTSHALGADVRDGEITDPAAYGFTVTTYEEEWQTMLRAVADAVGGCAAGAAGGGRQPVAVPRRRARRPAGPRRRRPSTRALAATGGTPGAAGARPAGGRRGRRPGAAGVGAPACSSTSSARSSSGAARRRTTTSPCRRRSRRTSASWPPRCRTAGASSPWRRGSARRPSRRRCSPRTAATCCRCAPPSAGSSASTVDDEVSVAHAARRRPDRRLPGKPGETVGGRT